MVPRENFRTKMLHTLAVKGIGGLLEPWQIKRIGMAQNEVRANEIRRLAQAERDATDIAAGLKDYQPASFFKPARLVDNRLPAPHDNDLDNWQGARSAPTLEVPEAWRAVTKSVLLKQIRHEINVAKAIHVAEDVFAEDAQEPPEQSVDDDWLFRWEEYAGKASHETLQGLWGRILAGEVKSPGQYSLRTLDFLRILSQPDAKLIELMAIFVVDGFIASNQKAYISDKGLSFDKLVYLQEIGILSGVTGGLAKKYQGTAGMGFTLRMVSHGKKVIFVSHSDSSKEIEIPIFEVTKIGNEIIKIGNFDPDIDYLKAVGKEILDNGQGFSVQIYHVE